MKTITAWSINIVWSDGEKQDVSYQIPAHIVNSVERWLDNVQDEVNAEEQIEEDEE